MVPRALPDLMDHQVSRVLLGLPDHQDTMVPRAFKDLPDLAI